MVFCEHHSIPILHGKLCLKLRGLPKDFDDYLRQRLYLLVKYITCSSSKSSNRTSTWWLLSSTPQGSQESSLPVGKVRGYNLLSWKKEKEIQFLHFKYKYIRGYPAAVAEQHSGCGEKLFLSCSHNGAASGSGGVSIFHLFPSPSSVFKKVCLSYQSPWMPVIRQKDAIYKK